MFIVFGAVTDAKQRPGFPANPPLCSCEFLFWARDERAAPSATLSKVERVVLNALERDCGFAAAYPSLRCFLPSSSEKPIHRVQLCNIVFGAVTRNAGGAEAGLFKYEATAGLSSRSTGG
jgi:hypothetical protein